MCYYAKYSSTTSNTVVYPITYDEVTHQYTVVCQTTHTILPEDLNKANADAQTNITALNNYDTVGATQEYQQIMANIADVDV